MRRAIGRRRAARERDRGCCSAPNSRSNLERSSRQALSRVREGRVSGSRARQRPRLQAVSIRHTLGRQRLYRSAGCSSVASASIASRRRSAISRLIDSSEPLSRPSVGRCPPRRTTCGQTARQTRACRLARTRAGPRSQPPRANPKFRPPQATHGTGNTRGLGFEHRGEQRRWAIVEPTPGTPSRPRGRNRQSSG